MEPFATLEELKARLDWTLDADEESMATAALEDASDLARGHGRSWVDATTAPRLVRMLVLQAVVRYMRNPEGYTQSRAGDETIAFTDKGDDAGTVHFTDGEIKLLGGLGGRSSSFMSVAITSWGTKNMKPEGFVPVDYAGKPFPFFTSDDGPWS